MLYELRKMGLCFTPKPISPVHGLCLVLQLSPIPMNGMVQYQAQPKDKSGAVWEGVGRLYFLMSNSSFPGIIYHMFYKMPQ